MSLLQAFFLEIEEIRERCSPLGKTFSCIDLKQK
jgi:hypothetical protein